MTIINEFLDLKNLDKLKTVGSFSGWQRRLYNLIIDRFSQSLLDRMMTTINKNIPEDADREQVKDVLKKAFLDYVDSIY
jgi:hypothetical protein